MLEKVNGAETVIYDGFVRILWEDKGKTILITANGDEKDTRISLNDCLEIIGYDGKGVVIVIFDDATKGKVYMYGNYGACWYEYGETGGYY